MSEQDYNSYRISGELPDVLSILEIADEISGGPIEVNFIKKETDAEHLIEGNRAAAELVDMIAQKTGMTDEVLKAMCEGVIWLAWARIAADDAEIRRPDGRVGAAIRPKLQSTENIPTGTHVTDISKEDA